MDILSQTSLLVAVTSFALGYSVLARNVKNKLFIAFAVVCTVISGWALLFFLHKILEQEVFYRLHLLLNVWLAPAALAFIRLMVRIQDRFSRRLLGFSVLMGLLLSAALVFGFDELGWVRALIFFAPSFILVQILELMWIDRRLRRGLRRMPKVPTVGLVKRNWIYIGAVFVLVTSVMDHVEGVGPVVPAIGNLTLTAYLFFVSQAISQQRLLNFSALITRFGVLAVIALTLTAIYSLLVAWIQESPGLFFLNSFIVSFLIVSLIEPLRSLVRYLTQRLLTQEHRKLEQTLRESQRKLASVVDPGSLFHSILLTVDQTLHPQRAALFVLRTDGTKYRRVRYAGEESPDLTPVREVLASHSLLQYCETLHRKGELPVILDQILEGEVERSASRSQQEQLTALVQALKALDCNLLIPLIDAGQILGFVTMYAPSPPEPWGGNWGILSIIYPYFEQAAQTLRNMEVYVRQREKERLATIGEMAAGLAHEIRNPLGAIKGAAQFLDPAPDKPETRFLNVILEEVDRLNRVVTQFLDYSKPPSVELRPTELNQLAERTIELLRPSLRADVRLEFSPSPGAPRVTVAPEQIQQVLINLIQNSYKALENGSQGQVRVSVEAENSSRTGEVHLVIEDNGPGIRREHMDKLFIPFFTTSPSGTGLGLSICQKIVEAHRGRIEVASEEGRFSRFSVILPAATGEGKA